MAPGSGALLSVRDCPYYPSNLHVDFWDQCSESVRVAFDVEFGRDVSNAVVTAGFYSGSQRCGLATSQPVKLSAGSHGSFEAGVILLSDEVVRLLCPLPAQTTRMVVQLWEADHPASPLLTQEFPHYYTFVEAR
jgi:hypothetical protein